MPILDDKDMWHPNFWRAGGVLKHSLVTQAGHSTHNGLVVLVLQYSSEFLVAMETIATFINRMIVLCKTILLLF